MSDAAALADILTVVASCVTVVALTAMVLRYLRERRTRETEFADYRSQMTDLVEVSSLRVDGVETKLAALSERVVQMDNRMKLR